MFTKCSGGLGCSEEDIYPRRCGDMTSKEMEGFCYGTRDHSLWLIILHCVALDHGAAYKRKLHNVVGNYALLKVKASDGELDH